jgi:dihydroorotate dehydrogenase
MDLYRLARPLLFHLDPETAHNLAMKAIHHRLGANLPPVENAKVKLFGVEFQNRVGLAAGFDKNAENVDRWHEVGFGFVEIGTVTQHPQPGNGRPRLFRYPEQKALINRMGFNNDGAEVISRRLAASKPQIPVGINIGKSKVTPLEKAAEDYAFSFNLLKDHGDYFVVNVSSPNTPGLRDLQEAEHLRKILWHLREIDDKKPMFVKLAPDLSEKGLAEAVKVAVDFGLTGLVATNTTLSRKEMPRDPGQSGGLSGRPLKKRADAVLKFLRSQAPHDMVFIGAGGVTQANDAVVKRRTGADLVQLYTGFVYGGPELVQECARALAQTKPQTKGQTSGT